MNQFSCWHVPVQFQTGRPKNATALFSAILDLSDVSIGKIMEVIRDLGKNNGQKL